MSTFYENSLGRNIDKKFSMDLNKSYGKFKLSNIEELLSACLKLKNIHIVTNGYFTSEVMYACEMYVDIWQTIHVVGFTLYSYECVS